MFSVEEDKKVLENKKPKKDSKLKNKKIIILGIVLLVIIIIGYIGYIYYQNNYVYLKEDKGKDIVYTIYQRKNNSKSYTEVPKINIKSSKIKKINSDIYKTMGKFLGKDTNTSFYSYEINGDILSLVLEMIDYSDPDVPKFSFKTYNIDLEKVEEVSDKELLKIYGINKKYAENKIENKFKYFYKDELKKGYLDKNECDYDCFLEYRNIDSYSSDLEYYVSDSKLYAYKAFDVVSLYHEENYFKEKDFLFFIAK
ncbi:MAG: hypothetical protein IJF92_03920 [Bacilli bacterium]|nr:hypothetical protein [Bacilli bacterium]